MAAVQDSLSDLERNRLLLEDNIKQLRTAIQHWQTWDAEYEALKEEVEAVTAGDSTREYERIKNEFVGDLIDQKEVNEIFGQQRPKSRSQIINVLERRLDYVGKSLGSLQKQLDTAEDKYAETTASSEPEDTEENGGRPTEILEELDEEDNVLSYRLNTPGEALPHIQEALKKAGVDDVLEPESMIEKIDPEAEKQKDIQPPSKTALPKAPTQPRQPPPPPKPEPKKAVSLVQEDEQPAEESKPEMSRTAKRVEHIMKNAKQQEVINDDAPVIPEGEEEDEAALRREMLKYTMGEVGAVVAELELEEGDSDDSDDYDFEYTDEDEDDEDNYGRTKQRVVTDDYRQRMLELEKSLGIKSRFTTATAAQDEDEGVDPGSDDERIGRIVVNHNAKAPSTLNSTLTSKPTPTKSSIKERGPGDVEAKKGVRFADSLDIAPADEPIAPALKDKKNKVDPLSDVIERSAPSRPFESKPPRKQSRFKTTRTEPEVPKGPHDAPAKFLDDQDDMQPTPTGPDGTTLADKLVERDSLSSPVNTGDFDTSDFHEVADEHQRLRRRFIERQGGFLQEDESPIKPLDETEGGPERVSRFRAARLSKQ